MHFATLSFRSSVLVSLCWALTPVLGQCQDNCQPACSLSLDQLAESSWPELEALYRRSPAGPIPTGYTRGRPIPCMSRPLARSRLALTKLVWRGKQFDDCGDSLINQWLGFQAVKARVYPGQSWIDQQPAIIMDYQGQSLIWADVRDELREVAPGLYLGAMIRRREGCPKFEMFFALEMVPTCPR